jgi:hypothetical protein
MAGVLRVTDADLDTGVDASFWSTTLWLCLVLATMMYAFLSSLKRRKREAVGHDAKRPVLRFVSIAYTFRSCSVF